MIENRAPGSIWTLRMDEGAAYVRTGPNDRIVLAGPDEVGCFSTIHLTRKDARLLAKRINQCLDATVKP